MVKLVKYRRIDYEVPVEVYRNLRKKVYSIRQFGRVVAHADEIALEDAVFHVSDAGRERVRKTGHKNVHAWVRGYLLKEFVFSDNGKPVQVTYNPKEYVQFVRVKGKKPVKKAVFVVLNGDGVFIDNSVNL